MPVPVGTSLLLDLRAEGWISGTGAEYGGFRSLSERPQKRPFAVLVAGYYSSRFPPDSPTKFATTLPVAWARSFPGASADCFSTNYSSMGSSVVSRTLVAAVILGFAAPVQAQVPQSPTPPAADTLHKFEKPVTAGPLNAKPWYRGKLVKASIVPALLIGYGISTINGNGFYSSYQAKADIQKNFPGFHTTVDNYLQFVPYLELASVALLGVETRDDRLNTLLVIGKAELIMLTSVYATKFITNIDRPNGAAYAFPSGHTAQAFLAASIVHTELRDKSQWYGVGAYAVATSVAGLRMLNNKH